ncbi:Carbohydrate-binding module family 13 protein [Pleurotus pulmonarius]
MQAVSVRPPKLLRYFLRPMGSLSRVLVTLLVLVLSVSGQTPAYQGSLLLRPGNNNGQCLTATSNVDAAPVVIQPCVGGDSQSWVFNGGSVTIFGGTKCLDAPGGNTADGAQMQIWTCQPGNPNQQWSYTFDYRLAWTNQGKCLDLPGGISSDNTRIQTWECQDSNPNQVWNTGYLSSALPEKSEIGQGGINNCGASSSQDSQCQTAWINDVDDFCLFAPPSPDSVIGDTERIEVSWCTKAGRGTRLIPDGTLQGVHFVKTQDYVQITGTGDFTRINIRGGDAGGELDPHGADGNGNPIGGLVFGNSFGQALQYHEWTLFISSSEFCFRACVGPNAARNCQHIYDVMGCFWNMPGNYDSGVFESCQGDNTEPMGVYGTSTWFQGVDPTPGPHSAAPSSSCRTIPTVSVTNLRRR